MTIIQLDPMEGTRYHLVQSQSHRKACWLEGYLVVPEYLEEKVYACLGHCELVIEADVLMDIIPLTLPSPLPAEPSEEEDTAAMLVDHEYRLTLLELGVI